MKRTIRGQRLDMAYRPSELKKPKEFQKSVRRTWIFLCVIITKFPNLHSSTIPF